MWIVQFIQWCISEFVYDSNRVLKNFSYVLQIFYSTQGIVLFCVVFFYRSTYDPNPVLSVMVKLVSRNKNVTICLNKGDHLHNDNNEMDT